MISGGADVPARADAPAGRWSWLGRVAFGCTARLQDVLREEVLAGRGPEVLLLCEHDPVITLGRRARPEHLLVPEQELARRGIAVHRTSRGGEVTYHGPGQLVGYPVVRLRRGVLAHVEAMAAALIEVLGGFDIHAEWRRTCPGVWVGDQKIAAFGVHVRRGVAVHGFALNVCTDLSAFDLIVACGLPQVRATSVHAAAVADLSGVRSLTPAALASQVADACARAFGMSLQPAGDSALSPLTDCQTEIRTDSMF